MTSSAEINPCPFISSGNEHVVLSHNSHYWSECRISPRAMTANLQNGIVGDEAKPWFAPDEELVPAVKLRKQYYAKVPQRILQSTKINRQEVRNAASQLLELQSEYLTTAYPDIYSIENLGTVGRVIINKATTDQFRLDDTRYTHPLAISGLLGQEDICIVEQTPDERQLLVAGFVATPTDWELGKLISKDMDQIHARFPGYMERLKAVVDSTMANLPEYPHMKYRNNLFLHATADLALFPPQPEVNLVSIEDPGNQIFIRTERETLTRLPANEKYPENGRYSIFTIKPHVYSLSSVAKTDKRSKLIAALEKNDTLKAEGDLAKLALAYLKAAP